MKWKVIVVLPFVTTTEAAGAPLILKSLAWTVDGSTGLLTFTTKSVGRVKMVIPHKGLVTEQGAAVNEATPTNVIVAIIKVVARVIFNSIITLSLNSVKQKRFQSKNDSSATLRSVQAKVAA